MPDKTYTTFNEAAEVATLAARVYGKEIKISRNFTGFNVCLPPSTMVMDWSKLSTHYRIFGKFSKIELEVIDLIKSGGLTGSTFGWLDRKTGLTWESSESFNRCEFSDYPSSDYLLMNALCYAGFDDWRVPSVAELKTLTPAKMTNLYSCIGESPFRYQLWSSENIFEDDLHVFFDVAALRTGAQHFREQDKNRVTRGDGYTTAARTITVRGSCSIVETPSDSPSSGFDDVPY